MLSDRSGSEFFWYSAHSAVVGGFGGAMNLLGAAAMGQTYRPYGVPLPTVWKTGFSFGEEVAETGDFNGDGLDDLITFFRSEYGGGFEWRCLCLVERRGLIWNPDALASLFWNQ